ncbi:MAG: GlsB/YeaQ/YmgE family stress response membrane protein [Actinomycetota bacterium]|nr:GlsB/YeaQ/YmgE family stress response membrane protein [Actinomycetota bacterium]
MGIIGWIILGLLAGMIAKAILPGDQPGGIIVTTLIGIAGALIAGFVAQALGFGDPIDEFFDLSTWISAIIGALVLLAIWGAVAGRRRTV